MIHHFADNLTLVYDAQAQLGEGPLWEPTSERLYWVDILNNGSHP